MKKRWLINFILLVIVTGLAAFVLLRPKSDAETPASHEISSLKMAELNSLKIEFPSKAPMSFEKVDGYWMMTAPYKARADQTGVQRILSIIAATSQDKFSADKAEKYGVDKPLLKVKMGKMQGGEASFIFGTYNPINENQYVAFENHVYLLSGAYSEAAKTEPIEMVDKKPLKPSEKIAGFNFSHLEQWEAQQLQVAMQDGKWTGNIQAAKLSQDEMNAWLDTAWLQNQASRVEIYTPNPREKFPYFEINLSNGDKIHVDKQSEAPELLLARPDEGLIYHFSNDVGFVMLNPPLNIK